MGGLSDVLSFRYTIYIYVLCWVCWVVVCASREFVGTELKLAGAFTGSIGRRLVQPPGPNKMEDLTYVLAGPGKIGTGCKEPYNARVHVTVFIKYCI